MTGCIEEKLALERHLSFVMGRAIDLRSPEILAISAHDLKRAYYRRAHEFHPDKAAGLGLDADYLTGQFRTLQDSYSFLLESLDSGSFVKYAGLRASQDSRRDRPTASGYTAPRSKSPMEAQSPGCSRSRPHAGPASSDVPASTMFPGSGVPQFRLRLAQYLYYTKKIDSATLIRALAWQYRVRPRLGDIGMSLGYLNSREVLCVIRQKKPAELFGETAVRLGYLSAYRLSVLMGRQRLLGLPIGRYFVENGFLSESELSAALSSLAVHNYRVRLAGPCALTR